MKNLHGSLEYTRGDLFGSHLRAQAYYGAYDAWFLFFPNSFLAGGQSFPGSQQLEDGPACVPEMEQDTRGPVSGGVRVAKIWFEGDDYTNVVNRSVDLKLGNLGSLRLGMKDLLNEHYFPVISQPFNSNDRFTAGRGRTINLTCSLDW